MPLICLSNLLRREHKSSGWDHVSGVTSEMADCIGRARNSPSFCFEIGYKLVITEGNDQFMSSFKPGLQRS